VELVSVHTFSSLPTSNCTIAPSLSGQFALPSTERTELVCTKIIFKIVFWSAPPGPSYSMKPNALCSLNHFTVPEVRVPGGIVTTEVASEVAPGGIVTTEVVESEVAPGGIVTTEVVESEVRVAGGIVTTEVVESEVRVPGGIVTTEVGESEVRVPGGIVTAEVASAADATADAAADASATLVRSVETKFGIVQRRSEKEWD
jgi:hypothetical protein